MDLELRIEKINSDFFNSNKNILSEKDLKELMDTRESEIRAIIYPYDSLEFEKEFSKICFRCEFSRLIKLDESRNITPVIKNHSFGFSQFDNGLNIAKQNRLLTSELLTKKDRNPVFNMKHQQSQSVIEEFKNPFPPKNFSKQLNIETKAAKSPNNSKFFDPVLKFIVLIIMIVAGLGSIILFLLRLGLSSG